MIMRNLLPGIVHWNHSAEWPCHASAFVAMVARIDTEANHVGNSGCA
jgi:hypothetical protein